MAFQVPLPAEASLLRSVEGNTIALSPDGSQLAWIGSLPEGSPRIWLRPLSQLDARPVAGTEGASALFWSPDSRSIAFFSHATLLRVDPTAGAPVPICPVRSGIGYTGTWGLDGQILFAPIQGDAIYRVSTSGGTPERAIVANRAAGELRVAWPWFLGDGRTVVYNLHVTGSGSWLMLARPGQAPQRVAEIQTEVQYMDPDYVVFAQNGALFAQRFDVASGRLTGEALPIAANVRLFASSGWAGFSASRTGTIALTSQLDQAEMVWADRTGHTFDRIGSAAGFLDDLHLSPDGRTVLGSRTAPATGAYDIWSVDLERGTETRVTTGADTEISPLVTPDQQTMIYSMTTGGSPQMYRRNLATGAEEQLAHSVAFQSGTSITHDGRTLVFTQRTDRGDWDLFTVPLAGAPTPAPLLTTPANETTGRLSPDDRLLAFESDETGHRELYVAPFPRMAPKTLVSTHGATSPRWTADGHELLYLADDGRLMSVTVSADPSVHVGTPASSFAEAPRVRWIDFVPMPDGKRILAIVPAIVGREQPITVLVNPIK